MAEITESMGLSGHLVVTPSQQGQAEPSSQRRAMNYVQERERVYTQEGSRQLRQIEREARRLIETAGALMVENLLTGDAWLCLNCLDVLEEDGVLRRVTDDTVAGQDRVYVAGPKF